MEKIDLKDRKLLLALWQDGRATTTRLGKQIGISQELVTYRLKRLKEKGILQAIVPIIDLSALGYMTYRLQLRLLPCAEEKKQTLIEDLQAIPQTSWVVLLQGPWDVVALFSIKTSAEFGRIYDQIMTTHGAIIDDKLFTIVMTITHLAPTYLLEQRREPLVAPSEPRDLTLDENQRRILEQLFLDGRRPMLEIARELGLAVSTIKYHMDLLEKQRIILGYKPILNLFSLGYEHFKVTIELANPADRALVNSELLLNPNVVYITRALGSYDIEFECEYDTVDAVLQFMEGLKSRIHIRKFDVIFSNKELVVNRVPK